MADQPHDTDYYILCPTREGSGEPLISHLISRDICRTRQDANYHKCPTCVHSDIWKREHPEEAEAEAAKRPS